MKDRKKWGIIVLVFTIMTAIAIVENYKSVFVPFFKEQLGVLDSGIGIINGLGTFAYLIFSLIGSFLCERFGQKKVFILGMSIMAVSLVLFGFTTNEYYLYGIMFIFNSALALISIAINTIIPLLAVGFQALLMNLTHLFYGLGASAAPKIGSRLLGDNIGWKSIYMYSSVAFVILIIIMSRAKMPMAEKKDESKGKKRFSSKDMSVIIMISIAAGFYVFSELETGTWFVNYLRNNFEISIQKSSSYISLFYVMLTIGRLFGGFVVEKVGYMKSIITFISLAAITYLSGIIIGGKLIILVSISGLFFSIVYPTLLVVISNMFKEKSASAIGIVVTLSSVVKMLLSIGFGYLNQSIGSFKAFYYLPVGLIISGTFILLANFKQKSNMKCNQGE